MASMKFGSDTSFLLVEKALQTGDKSIYKEELCSILFEDVVAYVNIHLSNSGSRLQQADKDDVVQTSIWKMWRYLPNFYFKATQEKWNENQRNGYLSKIVLNVIIDFWKKRSNKTEVPVDIDDEQLGVIDERDFTDRSALKEELYKALYQVFKEPKASAESLMAVAFSRFLGCMIGKNADVSEVAERLEGKPLREVYEMLVEDFEHVLDDNGIPKDVFHPLKEKIDQDPEKRFHMTSRQITLAGSHIVNKMKRIKNQEQS